METNNTQSIQKILVPTDFSENAQNALNYAIELAILYKAEVILFNAYHLPYAGATMMIDISDVLKKESDKSLEELREKIVADYPNIKVSIESTQNDLVPAIKLMLQHHSPDIIVMGTHGATDVGSKMFGTNTAAAIQDLDCPILAIPPKAVFEGIRNIALVSDLEPVPSEGYYQFIKGFTNKFDANLNLVSVNNGNLGDPGEQYQKVNDLEENFKDVEHKMKMVYDTSVVNGIQRYMQDEHNQVVIVLSRTRGFFQSLFHKSISRQLVHQSNIPLLVLHE